MAEELAACVPDYDPQEARRAKLGQASRFRRPEPFSGNLYAFEKARRERPAEQESMRKVPRARSRISKSKSSPFSTKSKKHVA